MKPELTPTSFSKPKLREVSAVPQITHFWLAKPLGSSVQKASWDTSCDRWIPAGLREGAANSQERGCLADLAAHVALFPPLSFPHPSSSSLLSAMTAACPKLWALGYVNISSSLKMPTSQLWCSLHSGSHQRVSCGGPYTAISQGQKLRRANDSNSWGSLWAGMTL